MVEHCGCYISQLSPYGSREFYLPQISLNAHATILSTASRTTLTQTFGNPQDRTLNEVKYAFPLYDGVSVVGFKCRIGTRQLYSKVKAKEQANIDYNNAIANQQTAAIMEYSLIQNDIFIMRIGNVPAREKVTVKITYVGELKQDARIGGIRYTLPNSIAPRYVNMMGPYEDDVMDTSLSLDHRGVSITADIQLENKSIIRELHSPSRSVKASLGRTSSLPVNAPFTSSQASATLSLDAESHKLRGLLDRDFVLIVKADGLDNPRALLESHATISGQRALMVTLVPKFKLPSADPEIIFVVDRSGSMESKIPTLKSALCVFLKSLPARTHFNICSFGHHYLFLWKKSKINSVSNSKKAMESVKSFEANLGGTKIEPAVKAAVQSRLKNKNLEILMLTDGEVYNQDSLFTFVRETSADRSVRFFSLGIGDAVSHSLIQGVARLGQGFSQTVLEDEELGSSVVKMLQGALSPHIFDYNVKVDYDNTVEDEFEVVEKPNITATDSDTEIKSSLQDASQMAPTPISLFDEALEDLTTIEGAISGAAITSLPRLRQPNIIQAPHKIPTLHAFTRTTVFMLLDPKLSHKVPRSLTVSATSMNGPLSLCLPVTDVGDGEIIHQLACRKAVIELEEKEGWLEVATDDKGNRFTNLDCDTQERIAARECQTMGIKYQVAGKHCSFVALESDNSHSTAKDEESETPMDYEDRTIPGAASSLHCRPDSYFTATSSSMVAFAAAPTASARGPPYRPPAFRPKATVCSCVAPSPTDRYGSAYGRSGNATRRLHPTPNASPSEPNPKVNTLIEMQSFLGNWKWDRKLFSILGCDHAKTLDKISGLLNRSGKKNTIPAMERDTVATLLVMAFLTKYHQQEKDIWELPAPGLSISYPHLVKVGRKLLPLRLPLGSPWFKV